MANKTPVSVKCVIKTIFDKSLSSVALKAMGNAIGKAIGGSSKLEVSTKSGTGFVLTATLVLTRNDKSKPPEIDAQVSISVMASGTGAAKVINASQGGSADIGSNPDKLAARATELLGDVMEPLMKKVVTAMESAVP
jgi:hypothetical protein